MRWLAGQDPDWRAGLNRRMTACLVGLPPGNRLLTLEPAAQAADGPSDHR